MNSPQRRLGALIVVLALGAGVACGDDDPTPAPQAQGGQTADAPTKAAFIASADEICAGYTRQMDEIFGPLFTGGEPQPAAVQESLGKVLDLYVKQVADLRGLTPPAADKATFDGLLAEADTLIAATRTRIADANVAMELIMSDEDPFSGLDEKMGAYGFKDCAGEGEQQTQTFGGEELSADEQAKATKLAVKGFDFRYEGVPASIAAGPAVFSFTNSGSEDHEIGVVKIKDGFTIEKVVELSKADPEDQSYVDRFLGAAYAKPGEGTDLSVKLDPGLYGFACFVEDAQGTPHFNHGMYGSFSVAG
jgi:plastocyanin